MSRRGDGGSPSREQQAWARDPEALLSVQRLARRLARRSRYLVSAEDLEALGRVGLAEAARRFDKDMGPTFVTYAWPRARGLMLDALKAEGKYKKAVTTGFCRFAEELCDEGISLEEGAAAPEDALQDLADAAMVAGNLSLVGQATRAAADGGEELATERVAFTELTSEMEEVLQSLPEVERELVQRHVREGQQLKALVATLKLRNYADARRLLKQALKRLTIRMRRRLMAA